MVQTKLLLIVHNDVCFLYALYPLITCHDHMNFATASIAQSYWKLIMLFTGLNDTQWRFYWMHFTVILLY